MHDYLDKNGIEVLMIIEGEIATTHLIERILMACGSHGIKYRKQFLSNLDFEDFKENTIPLFVRCADPVLEYWIDLLRRANYPYLYYIDDNFWRIDGDTDLARYYHHHLVRRSLDFAVANANKVLTNSWQLSEFISQYNQNTSVLPAFFDFSLIDGCVRKSTEEIRIGFAGSSSREADLEIIKPLIFSILKAHPSVVFEFAGAMPSGMSESERIRFFPHTADYASFVRFQAERGWAIGLAPLVDSEANRCKTNNKYREYGACKIAGVYSAIEPYTKSVREGVTGVLVQNTISAWMAAVNKLIIEKSLRKEISEHAYSDVLEKHSVHSVSLVWAECLQDEGEFLHQKNVLPLKYVRRRLSSRMFLLQIEAFWIQIETAYKTGGFSLIVKKALKKLGGKAW